MNFAKQEGFNHIKRVIEEKFYEKYTEQKLTVT